jgi:hypothetical protein
MNMSLSEQEVREQRGSLSSVLIVEHTTVTFVARF